MKLRHIEIFHAVYVTGSVSGAAKSLNVSQPTVSKVLKHAESLLGFDLFHREKGRIFPTEKGRLLFAQTLPVFEQINDLRKYAAMLASTRIGQLRLAMTPAFSLDVVPRALANFTKTRSDIYIEVETLHTREIAKAVLNKTADMGLVLEAVEAPGLKITPIGVTEFVCVMPSGGKAFPSTVVLQDLQDIDLIQLNAKSQLGSLLNSTLSQAWGQEPQGQIMAETYHLAKRLAARGAGAAIIDKVTALSGGAGDLSVHSISDLGPISIDLVTRVQEPFVGYKAEFLDVLKAAIAQY